MKRDDLFPSKYLKAADLKGKPMVVEIASADFVTLKNNKGEEQAKTCLSFIGGRKQLPLNMTNWDACADICGDDTDDWPGKRVEFYPDTTLMGGKAVDCIRVRAPAQRELPVPKPAQPKPPLADDMDDSLPF